MRGMDWIRLAVLPVLLGLAAPALADAPDAQSASVQSQVEAVLAAAPKGTRFGLLVVDETGKIIVSINPDQRFIPASNTKMFTTAAAYALLPGMDLPDTVGGTQVALVPLPDSGRFSQQGSGFLPGLGHTIKCRRGRSMSG